MILMALTGMMHHTTGPTEQHTQRFTKRGYRTISHMVESKVVGTGTQATKLQSTLCLKNAFSGLPQWGGDHTLPLFYFNSKNNTMKNIIVLLISMCAIFAQAQTPFSMVSSANTKKPTSKTISQLP